MSRYIFPLLMLLVVVTSAVAQQATDTVLDVPQDTAVGFIGSPLDRDSTMQFQLIDSIAYNPIAKNRWDWDLPDTAWHPSFLGQILNHHPYYGFSSPLASSEIAGPVVRKVQGKELLFYGIVFLLLYFALLKNAYPKYFKDLFRVFFKTTLKQKQIREQLIQTPVPSLLLNLFFILSAGLYITQIVRYFGIQPTSSLPLLYFYSCIILLIIYLTKFIGLKVAGWLFNMSELADSYIFIVFIINKMIGIMLIPFIIIISFSTGLVYTVGITASFYLVGLLIGYRYLLSFGAIRSQARVNLFHFFLYLIAFEIAPLLLVYKGLLLFFGFPA